MEMHLHLGVNKMVLKFKKKDLWVALGDKIDVRRIRPFINASPNSGKTGRIPGVHFN